MRKAIWTLGLMSTLGGLAAVFLVAPLAVDARLEVAYSRLNASPNLVAAISYGIVWALLAVAITAGVAHIAKPASRPAARVGACLLVVGLLLSGLILSSGTMSNAIADSSPSNWAAAELPAWVLGWVGTTSLVLAVAALLITAWQVARDRRRHDAAPVTTMS